MSSRVPSTSPRTHVTSHVAPPTYFCKPPCVWKYGGTSDSSAARPKFIAPVFTWKRWVNTPTERSPTKNSDGANQGKFPRGESSVGVHQRFTDLASPPWLNCLQSGYRREETPQDGSWTRKFGTKLKSPLESLDWRHLEVAAGDALGDILSALRRLFLFRYRRVRVDAWISNCCGLDVHLRVWRCIPPASVG